MDFYCSKCGKREPVSTRKAHCDCGGLWKLDFQPPKFDLGRIDRAGYLYFTGRKKNLIVLSNGENVSPERLEERLYRIDGVLDAVVYEKNGRITAEVYADGAVFPNRDALWAEIDRMNLTLAAHEQIGALVLRDAPFEKTVTQKIKRYE